MILIPEQIRPGLGPDAAAAPDSARIDAGRPMAAGWQKETRIRRFFLAAVASLISIAMLVTCFGLGVLDIGALFFVKGYPLSSTQC